MFTSDPFQSVCYPHCFSRVSPEYLVVSPWTSLSSQSLPWQVNPLLFPSSPFRRRFLSGRRLLIREDFPRGSPAAEITPGKNLARFQRARTHCLSKMHTAGNSSCGKHSYTACHTSSLDLWSSSITLYFHSPRTTSSSRVHSNGYMFARKNSPLIIYRMCNMGGLLYFSLSRYPFNHTNITKIFSKVK